MATRSTFPRNDHDTAAHRRDHPDCRRRALGRGAHDDLIFAADDLADVIHINELLARRFLGLAAEVVEQVVPIDVVLVGAAVEFNATLEQPFLDVRRTGSGGAFGGCGGSIGPSGGALYAMAWGINRGLLPAETFKPAVMKGYRALANNIQPSGMMGFIQRMLGAR